MEKFSEIIQSHHVTLDIEIFPCHRDHRFDGKAVFPAVEAMQVLAASVQGLVPDVSVFCIHEARFEKFLVLPITSDVISAYHHIDVFQNGRIASSLITKTRASRSGMTRVKSHVTIHFGPDVLLRSMHHVNTIQSIPKDAFEIPSNRLYGELVPFASAYHNVRGSAWISESVAVADVYAPSLVTPSGPLGSPFPLDAAFHIACAWSQRFAGIVAFPVGLSCRRIFLPTRAGERYRAVVTPTGMDARSLYFDIGLYRQDGEPVEMAWGVQMRDVSGGRMNPPEWVMKMVPV